MRGRRAARLSVRGWRSALGLVAVIIAAGAVAGVLSASATAAPPCASSATTDVFTQTTGDWSTPDNWSLNAPPTSTQVACWDAGQSVTISTGATETADSIEAGGDLDITSGVLELAGTDDSTVADLSLEGGGELDGPSNPSPVPTLTITGNFDWGGTGTGPAALNNGTTVHQSNLAINETGGSGAALTIGGTGSTPSFDGGSITTNSPVSITSSSFASSGTPSLTATSTITLGSAVNVAGSGATFTAAGVDATVGAPQSYGFGTNSLVLTGGATTVASGDTLDTGPLSITGGTLQDDGIVDAAPNAVTLTGSGELEGTGTVDGTVTNTSGTVSPGDGAAGALTVVGSYAQGSGGTLAIEIAGTTPGSGFGQLAVQGAAALDGSLSLTDVAFTPAPADTFQILTSTGSRTGTFSSLAGTDKGAYVPEYHSGDVTLVVVPANCTGNNPDVYTASSGSWSTAGNWSTGAPPSPGEVACWAAGTTVTVSDSESADSIEADGNLAVASSGVLELTSSSEGSTVGALSLEVGGELDGPTSPSAQTLTVTGNFDWGGGTGTGTAALNGAPNSNLAIDQTAGAGGSLTIDGTNTSTPALDGGSVSTNSPVSITNSNFQGAGSTSLTVSGQAVTFGSGVNLTSGSGGTIVAAGIDTVGGTNTVQSFALHLTTGASSSLAAASTLNVGNLTTDSGTTLAVPSGVALNVVAGTIAGTINGAGAFTSGIGATSGTIEVQGALSTGTINVPVGTLTVDSGAKYGPATATTISGGTLNLNSGGSTAALSLEGGQLNGSSGNTLTVTGAFDWGATSTQTSAGALNAAGSSALAIAQTGGGSFTIDSPVGSSPQFAGGSITTTSPVSITSPTFTTTDTPTLTTSSTITLGTSVTISGIGATFSAAGVDSSGGSPQSYGFGTDGLTLTGGTTTVASSNTLSADPLTLTGGTLEDDGTVTASSTTLTGGTLDGTGTIDGPVTNTSGTVSPGDGAPGILTITGSYGQGSGGKLAVELDGTTAGTGSGFFAQLEVSGTATVSGTLSVTDDSGFTPTQANTFAILISASLSGEFTQLSGNAASTYFAQYGAQNVTLAVTSSSCPMTNFDAYSPSGGDWSTAANWSKGAPPTAGEVACWAAGVTVTVSSAESATSIQAGGTLDIITGGVLKLGSGTATTTSTVGGLMLEGGGELDAPSSPTHAETLDVIGPFDWGGTGTGNAALNHATGSNLEVIQPAGQTLTIDGTSATPAFDRGSIVTDSPVTITNSNFAGAAGATLTDINQPVTFGSAAAGIDLATGAGTIVAAGIDTVGATNTVTGFALHLTTGASSSLAAGSLNVENLTTDSGTTLPVPSGTTLGVFAGTISGAITGAGTYTAGLTATGGITEVASGGSLATAVDVERGSITVDSGAAYTAAATTIGAGTLTLDAGGTTGALAVTGGGEVNGVSGNALTVSGAVTWSSGTLNDLALTQTGTGFSVSGTATTSLAGGSVTTGSPVSITSTHFQTSGAPTLSTASTITLGPSVAVTGSGATFAAAGLGPPSGSGAGTVTTTYDFGSGEALRLTGGATAVTSSAVVLADSLTLTAGTLEDDGTVTAPATLTGGTLDGTGTITGALTNSAGTVAPGDAAPGLLTVGGNYSQGGGGMLAIELGGTTAGSGFGALQVNGSAALGGDLSLTDVNGFAPATGGTFEILSSSSARTGAMTVTGPSSALYNVRYDPSDVTLTTSPTPANIVAPTITGTPAVGQTLACSDGTWSGSGALTFTFQWNRNGSAIAGATNQTYLVSTADRGAALTCTVIASNGFGQGPPATSAALSIPTPPGAPSPPLNVVLPVLTGTPTPGNHLSCSSGSWLPSPAGFTYQWRRGGSPIPGATRSTYTVQIADEGASLTCLVSASNAGGSGVPAASTAVIVAEPGTLTCAKPRGALSGRTLGPLQLGFKRARARHALPRYTANSRTQDFYCLYGGWGIHAGYPSSGLLKTVSARLKGRIVLALTSNPFYSLNRTIAGTALASVAKRLHVGKVIHIGANDWYIVPGRVSRGVLRVRSGIIQEIGIAAVALTNTRTAQRRLLSAFNSA